MKVGLLGGSFNPVHNGHLRLAVEALEQGGVDRVELVPAFIPPHKEERAVSSFAFRSRLIEAAIAHMPGLGLNPMEGQRRGPSYTVDTLNMYRRLHPEHEPFFLIGCPDFVQLPKWHQWQRLIHLTHFIIVAREEGDDHVLAQFIRDTWPESDREGEGSWVLPGHCRVRQMQTPILEISSSLIREKLAQGKCIRYLVPEPVWKELSELGSDFGV
ncbi:MAG: nicotinate (nicotinamide) nucleotide adenylyltransferase [Desulfovermiculus sp.]|nr:nicotinate (nicotinamide) nucleotide adenylyltransferase [Desulfovermiculus sp.]